MTIRLAVRLDADLAPFRDGMAEAGTLLEEFGSEADALGDTLSGLGATGSAAVTGIADAAQRAGQSLPPLGTAGEQALSAVAAASRPANDGWAALPRRGTLPPRRSRRCSGPPTTTAASTG